jgi:hypothetical protein
MHSRSCFQHTTLGLQARQQPAQGTGHASQTTTERDEGRGGGGGAGPPGAKTEQESDGSGLHIGRVLTGSHNMTCSN